MGAQPFTPAQLQEARKAASIPERRLIDSLKSGETEANDPSSWIADLERDVSRIEAGECDSNFTIWQRMHFHLTGQCVPLLA